ncbi:MAG: M64 family metallo-endopeptidase [Acidobacteria bacterium]|nr:M64 family metallo-endopeptidase [Acidobacteriota bacterium]
MPRTVVLLLVAACLGLPATGAEAEPVEVIRSNGPNKNRINVAILGDGYTRGELGKYANDVERLVAGLFRVRPFADYAAYFNVRRVDVTSNESGADHPARNVYRDTALGARYDCFDITWLICIDQGAVVDVLGRSLAVNERDIVMVLVNDDQYGGAGSAFAVASRHRLGAELMLHELGHSFGRLADEYAGGGPACNSTVEPPEVNVTRGSTAASIKWSYWIEPGTPVPATNTTRGVVSAYEGAKYCDSGLYRPTFDSKMRTLSKPFGQVNTEQLIRRIYNFVSPIDAVSPTTTGLKSERCESLEFAVKTPGDLHARPGTIRSSWSINGEVVATANSLTVGSCRLPVGSHRIEVEVQDVTAAVRRDFNDALVERFRWDLETTVSGGNRPPEPVGALPPLTLGADGPSVAVEVGGAFRDPDGDALTYRAASSAPAVAAVTATGSAVTVTPVAEGTTTVTVTATDVGGSNTAATQTFTVTVGAANRPPEAVGALAPLAMGLDDGAMTVDVSGAFRDADGDALTYRATSSAPAVAAVSVSGSAVTVTPVSDGTTTVTVTATDVGGSNTAATQAFRVMVPRPFTDPVITPGATPVRAVHFTELRTRIDGVRASVGLGPYTWTDPVLTAGSTRVRLVHLLEMRWALTPVFAARGGGPPFWTDAAPTAGSTPIRAAHLLELRAAVVALE